ncbi:endonuclease/exonuclease/phosphatase family protein [Nocardioides sp.]|uniref:endonuclease/exonuclease/phosphatase family protein n=1 Tax=Nocardioides sp. TaxID=35761 RepID=UPI0037833523
MSYVTAALVDSPTVADPSAPPDPVSSPDPAAPASAGNDAAAAAPAPEPAPATRTPRYRVLESTTLRPTPEAQRKVVVSRYAARGFSRVDPTDLQATSVTIASFNVLGASHSASRGARSGVARMASTVGLLRAHGVSVVGLQEFQEPQYRAFESMAGGEYDVWPGVLHGTHVDVQNSIAWRSADWSLVEAHTLSVPYFFGHRVPMPVILLENRDSGRRVWFMNFHNPADAHGNAAGYRAAARAIEAAEANRLKAEAPVVLTGDMNDRSEFACPFAAATGMHSADGVTDNGHCTLPQHTNVDWIFGTPDIEFSSFVTDFSTKDRGVSDHPMVRATLTLPAVADPAACEKEKAAGTTLWFCPRR